MTTVRYNLFLNLLNIIGSTKSYKRFYLENVFILISKHLNKKNMFFYVIKMKLADDKLMKAAVYYPEDTIEQEGYLNKARIIAPKIKEIEAVFHTQDVTEEDIYVCASFDDFFDVLREEIK